MGDDVVALCTSPVRDSNATREFNGVPGSHLDDNNKQVKLCTNYTYSTQLETFNHWERHNRSSIDIPI